jgi:hypothetical protein
MNAGIVTRQDDPMARNWAAKLGLGVEVRDDWALPFERTLFITPGVRVPWALVSFGFDFVTRWDVAAPLWRKGVLASDLGSGEERRRTLAMARDLRMPVYAHELLFVRKSPDGQAFVSAWRAECAGGGAAGGAERGDERLAFVRALCMTHPRLCALPRAWLADVAQREVSDRMAARRQPKTGQPLIQVEIAPGRFVRCHAEDRERVLAEHAQRSAARHRGRR